MSRSFAFVLLAMLVALGGCRRAGPATPALGVATPNVSSAGGGKGMMMPEPTPHVSFRLSDAEPDVLAIEPGAPLAPATPLADAEAEQLLARLPALPETAAEQAPFAIRPGPRPPSVSGDRVREPFPPTAPGEPAPEVPTEPLEVERYQPEGDVDSAPLLAITFSQAMVPLTSIAALAERDRPVRLVPEPRGTWRWVGTRTLLFEPDLRFPMATEYRADVPAGTASLDGGRADTAFEWTFRTPPLRLVSSHPSDGGGPTDRQPVLYLEFDQVVDAAAIADHLVLRVGRESRAVRLATPAEVAADEAVAQASGRAPKGRWLAVRPSEPLPVASRAELLLPPGLPSAEGPRTTEAEQRVSFDVYGPFAVRGIACAAEEESRESERGTVKGCDPVGGWEISFTNPIDRASVRPEDIAIEPELASRLVWVGEDEIQIGGIARGRTRYVVRLPEGLRDRFGQPLAEASDLVFETGDAPPALYGPQGSMVALDPSAPPELWLTSVNNDAVSVRLYTVQPSDLGNYLSYVGAAPADERGERRSPPGLESWKGTVRPGGARDALVRFKIDLRPALADGLGHVIAVVEPAGWSPEDANWRNRPVTVWVQSTRLGLDVFGDSDKVVAWVTSLADGTPIAGAEVRMEPEGATAVSGPEGVATVRTRDAADRMARQWREAPERFAVVARLGNDSAILASLLSGWYPTMDAGSGRAVAWHVFDDRGIYRPGEEVHVKGWLRVLDTAKGGDVEPWVRNEASVDYKLLASNGEEVLSGALPISDRGGFDASLRLPDDIELGDATLSLSARGADLPTDGRDTSYRLNVSEFRRPEFEVKARSEAPYFLLGSRGTVTAEATYYAGGALSNADVAWSVYAEATIFTPPGRDDFHFGTYEPWPWRGPSGYGWMTASGFEQHRARTDASGEHRLAVDFDGVHPLSAVSFRAEATVQDVNRQAWTGTASFLVHPARHYVGLRPTSWFAERGKPVSVESVVADIDGALVSGSAVAIVAERVEWVLRAGEYVENPEPADACQVSSGESPASCTFTFDEGGQYRLTASVVDPEGRANRSTITLWVSGGELPVARSVEAQRVVLVPGAEEYQPGDTAQILVQAPFYPAEGLLTLRRSGIVGERRFRMDAASTTLSIPIDESHMPNLVAQVDLVGAMDRTGSDGEIDRSLPRRPAYASGQVELAVPARTRTLTVEPAADDSVLEPGQSTTVEVAVRDAGGTPVEGAEVALIVVDESVPALVSYEVANPIESFYPPRYANTSDGHQRDLVEIADAASLLEQAMTGAAMGRAGADYASAGMARSIGDEAAYGPGRSALRALSVEAPMGDALAEALPPAAAGNAELARQVRGPGGAEGMAAGQLVPERSNLDPVAAFEPALRTGADGTVSVALTLPDSVTRYRVTAVAADDGRQFGKGESTITARLPLAVRPSAPRFLNYGDAFELPVVVQNQTDSPLDVDVVARGANLLLTEGSGRRVTVPANDRVEVRFPAAAQAPGTALLQAGAFSGSFADAQRISLPVWTPATTEAFATYGELDAGAVAQPVARPPDVIAGFGGLELSTSSTALSSLTDAYLYLQSYPFECAEQVASRLLATIALEDVLTAFGAEGLPGPDEIDASIRRDVARLASMRNPDGGFGWWGSGDRRGSDPFLTVHVTHALARARAKGRDVPDDTLQPALGYLSEVGRHLAEWKIEGPARDACEAYALYARSVAGQPDAPRARALFASAARPYVETLGWLLAVMAGDPASANEVARIRRELANRASEEAGTAQFTTAYEEAGGNSILASDRRADAVVLDALMTAEPESTLVPKVVRGLLGHRTRGRWASTQENAFVLLALDRYFRTYEAQAPDFVARAWLGTGFLGDVAYRGRTADLHVTSVPMSALAEGTTEPVVIAKDGSGRLYYRLGLRYAPESLVLEPSEHGFSVARAYEAVDDPADVRQSADGTWQIRAGSRVRIRLHMVSPSRRYHVALVDPLPAGFEALDPDLAVTGSVPPGSGEDGPDPLTGAPRAVPGGSDVAATWLTAWYDHDAFRDERTEVFASLVLPGVYTYSYVARATTPGTFVVPPARAEEMYHPETFGRSASERVEVK